MKNFSQNKEQEVILNYFGDYVGTFCDLGANDGITLSNTYALALKGWKGACIEASPKAYSRLYSLYGESKNIKVHVWPYAIGAKGGKFPFKESGEQLGVGDTSLVSTFHQHEMDRFKKSVKYEPIEVEVFTWNDFISISPYDTFDFISMDIEGCEMEVLPQMDLSGVKLFCIEWNSKPELKKAYDPYFEGFKVIYTSAENLIYAR